MTDQPTTSVPTPEPAPETSGDKTFTQAQVDAIIKARLEERRSKYADYEDLKAKAERLDKIEEAQKSEQQKLQDQIALLKKQTNEANVARTEALIRASAIAELGKNVPVDRVSAAYKLLDKSSLTLNGETVDGLSAAIEAMLKENPFLKEVAKPPTTPTLADNKPKISPANPAGSGDAGDSLAWLKPNFANNTFGDGYLREPHNKG